MTSTTTTTTKREKLIRKLTREWRDAVRREEAADDIAASWKLAARSDKARRMMDAAIAGIEIPAPRTKRNMALGAFAALASIGRVFARVAAAKAGLAKARIVNAARRAGARTSSIVRASLRRVVAVVVMIALFLAVHTNKGETKMKSTKKNTSTKSTTVALNAKERALLKELQKKGWDGTKWIAVAQTDLFCAFERGDLKAKNHERAGWDVRNSSRKLIALRLATRAERGHLKLTKAGAEFSAKAAR